MTLDDINAELDRLKNLPVGPNQAMYVRGAVQALLWLRDHATPPSNIFEVVCRDARSPT